jgi:hypothetical protein
MRVCLLCTPECAPVASVWLACLRKGGAGSKILEEETWIER